MIVTKETGTRYSLINQPIIDWHDENNMTIACVNRPATYDENGNYVDDVTTAEINAGREHIRSYLYIALTDALFFKYQRGEVAEQVWLDAVQAVKDQYPDIEE
jgi:hypothetical protein